MEQRQEDIISRVSIRNHEEMEVKLEYVLDETAEVNNYKVEAYFFIPQSFNLNPDTYSKEAFYSDLQKYLRFRTPIYSFKELCDPAFVKSPLCVLRKLKDRGEKNLGAGEAKEAVKELQLLCSITRARLRHFRREFETRPPAPQTLKTELETFLEEVFTFITRFHQLREEYHRTFPAQKRLLRYLRMADEFITNVAEFEICRMLLEGEEKSGKTLDPDLLKRLDDFFQAEEKYLDSHDFRLHFNNRGREKERYLYYLSQYKKLFSSVLFLNIKQHKPSERQTHILGALAAFAASLFAYLSLAWISQKFAVNTALFMLMASVSYMFKDRIKEVIKLIGHPKMLSRFPDFDTAIFDPENPREKYGNLREKMVFLHLDKVDPLVLSLRETTRKGDHHYEEQPENILLYQKEVDIKTANILQHHSRRVDITDLTRYNLTRYFQKLDEPEEEIFYYDVETKTPRQVTGSRCYFINLILKYTTFLEHSPRLEYQRFRIILNKERILEIEPVAN